MPTKTDELTTEQRGHLDTFFVALSTATEKDATAKTKKEVYRWLSFFLCTYGADFMNKFIFPEDEEGLELFNRFWNSFRWGEAAVMFCDNYIQPIVTQQGIESCEGFDVKCGRANSNHIIPRSHYIGLGDNKQMGRKVNNALQKIFSTTGECCFILDLDCYY